jgi:hypothetical protein
VGSLTFRYDTIIKITNAFRTTVTVALPLPRVDVFPDRSFAWELLEQEILIEEDKTPDGTLISNLLQLYMVRRGLYREESRL